MGDKKRHIDLLDASKGTPTKCSPIKFEFMGASGFFSTYCAGSDLKSKIVNKIPETPEEIGLTKKATSFRQIEMALKSLKYVCTKIHKTPTQP